MKLHDIDEEKLVISTDTLSQLKKAGLHTLTDGINLLWHHIGCGIDLPHHLKHIPFDSILSELKRLHHWPDTVNCKETAVENFNVSVGCRKALLRNGIVTVKEVIEAVEYELIIGPHPFSTTAKWIKHIPEIIQELQKMGCWPECDE